MIDRSNGYEQRRLIERVAKILTPGGGLLFTAEANEFTWTDAMTERESRSLGAEEYRRLLRAAGLTKIREYQDEGENYYFDAVSL